MVDKTFIAVSAVAGPILMVMGEALHPAIGWAMLSAVGFLLTMYAIYLTIHRIRRPRGEGATTPGS